MLTETSPSLVVDSATYRRRARKLRAKHRDEPVRMYAALRKLADESDATFNKLFNDAEDAKSESADLTRADEMLDAILADLAGGEFSRMEREGPRAVVVRRTQNRRNGTMLLAELNRVIDGTRSPASAPSTRADFDDEIAAALDGDLLRFSDRERLLVRAAVLGISRFDANLMIARVQNGETLSPYAAAVGERAPQSSSRAASHWLLPVSVALATQASLIAVVWWLVAGAL